MGERRLTILAATFLVLIGCNDSTHAAHGVGASSDARAVDGGDATDVEEAPDAGGGASSRLRALRLSRTEGPTSGGDRLSLYGDGFADGARVTLGGAAVEDARVVGSDIIRFTTPPHRAGSVELKVEQHGEATRLEDAYKYREYHSVDGDPLDDTLRVRVVQPWGERIEDAYVAVTGTDLEGRTDENGTVEFVSSELSGSQTVVAATAYYGARLIAGVERSEVTVAIGEAPHLTSPVPPRPTATLHGELRGLDELSGSDTDGGRFAQVLSTYDDVMSVPVFPRHQDTLGRDGSYELTTRTGKVAVAAIGSVYDEETDNFVRRRLGLARGLVVEDDQTYEHDLELDIRLDERPQIEWVDASASRDEHVHIATSVYLNLEADGFLPFAKTDSDAQLLEAPALAALDGPLDEASYVFKGHFESERLGGRYGRAFIRGVDDVSESVASDPVVGRPELTHPSGDEQTLRPGDEIKFEYEGNREPDFFYVSITTHRVDDPVLSAVWEMYLPAGARSVELPEFPDFSDFSDDEFDQPEPYPDGTYYLSVSAYDFESFDYERFVGAFPGDQLRSHMFDIGWVEFASF